MSNVNPRLLDLDTLAKHCQRENELYRHREPYDQRYCYEIFRRAVMSIPFDELAWIKILEEYHPWIVRRIRGDSRLSRLPNEIMAEDLAQEAIFAFQRKFNAEAFLKARDLESISAFLWQGVTWTIADALRKYKQRMARDTSLDDSAQNSELETEVDKVDPNTPNLERQVLAQSTCGQLWEKVRGHCDGELDLIVLRLIVEDLKPGQLYSENRDKFNDISEIHQRRQNLVDRLKRNGEILQLLEDCTDVRPQDRLRRTRRKKS